MRVVNLNSERVEQKFVTIASFQYSSEAQIIKGRLEAENIMVFMSDNLTIDTDPIVSNALGGVKLKVYSEDEQRAVEILKSINKYSLDDEGKVIICPKCDSEKVEYFTNVKDFKSFFFFLIGLLFGVLPFYTKYEYRCENCKTKFNLE